MSSTLTAACKEAVKPAVLFWKKRSCNVCLYLPGWNLRTGYTLQICSPGFCALIAVVGKQAARRSTRSQRDVQSDRARFPQRTRDVPQLLLGATHAVPRRGEFLQTRPVLGPVVSDPFILLRMTRSAPVCCLCRCMMHQLCVNEFVFASQRALSEFQKPSLKAKQFWACGAKLQRHILW